jgi:hypothetical protein
MATLEISVKKYFIGEEYFRTGIIGNIYSLSGLKKKFTNKTSKNIYNLIFPISNSLNQGLSVNVIPGRYLIEAYLPSGQVIDEEVLVETDAQKLYVILFAEESPHEWLSWMQFAGYVEKTKKEYRNKLSARNQFQAFSDTLHLVSNLSAPINDKSFVPLPDGIFFKLDKINPRRITDFPNDVNYYKMGLNDFLHSETLSPQDRDSISRYFTFNSENISKNINLNSFNQENYHQKKFQRFYLCLCKGINIMKYSVLPSPWMSSDNTGELLVEAWVRENEFNPKRDRFDEIEPETRTDIFINVRDRITAIIINYLGAGEIPIAKTVLEPAQGMLYEKLANPIAAAAGAYILLLTDRGAKKQPWYNWIENLKNWFPWLPDGAIQHAWLKLRMLKDNESIESIRDLFMDAYKRGLPFYSRGVSMLYDGLTIVENNLIEMGVIDKEVEDARKTVQFLASRTNMRLPFTTVDLTY